MFDFKGRSFANFSSELLAKFIHIVRKDGRLMAGSGDGNITET